MLTATDEHPPLAVLIACGQGRLTPSEQRGIEDHVMHCDRCVQALWKKGDVSQATLGSPHKAPVTEVPRELHNHPRYRILGPLGAGGMGVVFKAEHRIMGRKVALKVMAQRYLANPEAVERFRREVRAAAKLSHPNIVTAHDADSAGGLHFLVMEFVHGVSLDRVVAKRGQQPIAVACQCIRQAAQGLQHASKLGMVHRDIKPHNLMVTRKGQIKILDFGLARFVSESDTSRDTPALPPGLSLPGMTSASMVIGTPDYLAPEQARCAKEVDIRADIYGLGCTLYFLLSGRPPFADIPSAFEKMLAHADTEPPKIESLRGDVPEALIAILEKMLAKRPEDRYSTPLEVAAALHPFTKAGVVLQAEIVDDEPNVTLAESLSATPLPRRRRKKRRIQRTHLARKNWLALGGGILGVLCAIALGLVIAKVSTPKSTAAESSQPSATPTARPAVSTVVRTNKILLVLPQKGVHSGEYKEVRQGLEKRGFTCVVAAKTKQPCYQEEAGQWPLIFPTVALPEVSAADYDAVVFIGNGVWDYLHPPEGRAAIAVRALLDAMLKDGKPVAGIGRGQIPLLLHRLLDNRQAAWNQQVEEEFPRRSVTWAKDQTAIDSDGILTAKGAGDADALAELIAKRLPKLK